MNRAIRSLLASIIDYAGLFPPAELHMGEAVANFAKYRAGENAWMLGRFIVPAARLAEFESAARQHVQHAASSTREWRISVLAGTDLTSDLAAIAEFNERQAVADVTGSGKFGTVPRAPTPSARTRWTGQREGMPALVIDAIELKAVNADDVTGAMRRMPSELFAYFEVPVSSTVSLLTVVRSAAARVKVRTGGVTAQAFPSCAELAGFLARAAAVGVPFKATAGLHHPIRSEQRLTYANDSPRGTMHGFLNVFLAAAGLRAGMTTDEADQLLEETSPRAFQFDEHGASWRHHHWTSEQLQTTRQDFAISFGSCSFQEPIDDLKAIGIL